MSTTMDPRLLGLAGIISGVENWSQNQKALAANTSAGQNAITGYAALGGQNTADTNIGRPSGQIDAFGNKYVLPDVMGSIKGYGQDLYNRLGQDTQFNTGQLGALGGKLNDIYGSQYNNLMGQFGTGAAGLTGMQGKTANDLIGSYYRGAGALGAQAQSRVGDVLGTFGQQAGVGLNSLQSRYGTLMGSLQGMGDEQARQINEQFNQNKGNIAQGLASRGLGNTTVQASAASGNERERANALGNLSESVRQQKLGIQSGALGDIANAQLGYAGNYAGLNQGLTGDVLNMSGQLFSGGQNLAQGLQGQALNLAQSNFGNQMNLASNLVGQATGAQVANASDMANAAISGNAAQTGQLGQTYGAIVNQQNANANNMIGTMTGANYGYPDNQQFFNNMYMAANGIGQSRAADVVNENMRKARDQQWATMFMPHGGLSANTSTGLGASGSWGF